MSRNLKITFFVSVFLVGMLILFLSRTGQVDRLTAYLFPTPTRVPMEIKGIGVIGDSLSDEYQADDARGFQYSQVTLNWVEQLVKSRNMDFGIWSTWGDVRRTGFAYNWSRTGASSASIIANGQHTGLAQQIRDGEVNVVIVYVGANDFAPHNIVDGYFPIYNGELSSEALERKISNVTENLTTTLDTLSKSGSVHIFLVTIPDWNLAAPFELSSYSVNTQRVSDIISVVNNKLIDYAKENDISVIDVNEFYSSLVKDAPLGSINVGSETISLLVPNDDPRQAFLSDGAHPGTVLNGLFANYILEHLNSEMAVNVDLLSEEEILGNAGL